MRWIPFDPPWLVLPYLVGAVAAAALLANDLVLLHWVTAAIAIVIGALGMERWYDRRHPRPRR
jgi:hypothetical protein